MKSRSPIFCFSMSFILRSAFRNSENQFCRFPGGSITSRGFAGHSKWANIKHKKARNDMVKEKQGTVFSRLIASSVNHGGGPNISTNFTLNSAVTRAKKAGMSSALIERAIAKGSGMGPGNVILERHVYEGKKGIALFLVEVLTDNKNRAVAEMRHTFKKYGGSVGANVARFAFQTRGSMTVDVPESKVPEEVALEALNLNLDSDYFDSDEPSRSSLTLYCNNLGEFQKSSEDLRKLGYNVYDEQIIEHAIEKVDVMDDKIADDLGKLTQELEDRDDVVSVFHNLA